MTRMTATTIKPSREILAENLTQILSDLGRGSARRLAEAIGWQETRIAKYKSEYGGNPDLATVDLIVDGLAKIGFETSVGQLLSEN